MKSVDHSDAIQTVTIKLDPIEVQFLITVLKSSSSILTALTALQDSFPGLSPSPVSTDAIVNITALAEKIQQQI
jgi:hypothetical protein